MTKKCVFFSLFLFFWSYAQQCNITYYPNSTNTSRNCSIALACGASGSNDCSLVIQEKMPDWDDFRSLPNPGSNCNNSGFSIECKYPFLSSVKVRCASIEYGLISPSEAYITVIEFLEKVQCLQLINKSFTWKRPHTIDGIDVKYEIQLSYENGSLIQNATINNTHYTLPDIIIGCQIINLTITALVTCGNVSSQSSHWIGSTQRPSTIPFENFTVNREIERNIVSVDIFYVDSENNECTRGKSAKLNCSYKDINVSVNYNLSILYENGHVVLEPTDENVTLILNTQENNAKLNCSYEDINMSVNYNLSILYENCHVVLEPTDETITLILNDIAECELTFFNEAGSTYQGKRNISTYPLQNFTITVDKTNVCMELKLLKGSNTSVEIEFNGTSNHEPYLYGPVKAENNMVNISKCFSPSLPNGYYDYCVFESSDSSHRCIAKSSTNVTNGTASNPTDNGTASNPTNDVLIGLLSVLLVIAVIGS